LKEWELVKIPDHDYKTQFIANNHQEAMAKASALIERNEANAKNERRNNYMSELLNKYRRN
jgi:ABC-type proline/glycine betaine transport system ATPase subunit